MKSDAYTKIILTVIAVSLVWLSLGGPAFLTTVEAQSKAQEVWIKGWLDDKGNMRLLPQVGREGNFPTPIPVWSNMPVK